MKVRLTSDGSRTLYSDLVGESYHSESGAWSESQVVYLKNSGAAGRLEAGLPTRILEIGLGTGLNLLATADVAVEHNARLEYVGVDIRRLPANTVRELGFQSLLIHRGLVNAWLKFLEQPRSDGQQFEWVKGIWLTPICGAAEILVPESRLFVTESFDLVYHDAFSPVASPELWTAAFLSQLHRILKQGGKLTTYCVKSEIQKRMEQAGFRVQCVPGPEGGKRQVLVAEKTG